MKKRMTLLAMVVALVGAVAAPVTAAAQPEIDNPLSDIPITGTVDGGGTFDGTLDITGFDVQDGELVAIGTLTGTITGAATNGDVTEDVTMPVGTGGQCPILDLTLGPLDLNLLGLMVHLDQVVLDITAQSGPGNLLGNLLCAVTGLLDSNASPIAVDQLLNRLNQLVGTL